MPKLPVLTGRELIKVLENMGFQQIRQSGSPHVFLRHPDGRTTTVSVHAGETIDRGLLNKIFISNIIVEEMSRVFSYRNETR